MKTLPLLVFAACLGLAGCVAPPSAETSAIVRHAKATVTSTHASIIAAAFAHGYSELSPGMFQKTVARQRDPILELIPVDGEPAVALAFRVTYDTNTTGTLITVSPFIRFKHVTNDGYRERALPLNSPDRTEIVDMIDRIVAELEYAKS